MIQVDNVILSEELFEEHFVCDLNSCKGACCIEGDAGAPLDFEEIEKIEENLDGILPFLTEKGRDTLRKHGVFELDVDREYVTPLNGGKECAFTTFDTNGIAKCGIEEAYRNGKSTFKKPSSCHLYPIRITKLSEHDALNYHRWSICKPACDCGAKLKMKVYQFLKEPLMAKYGEAWFDQLVEVEKLLQEKKS